MNSAILIAFSLILPCLATTLGALCVFFFKSASKKLNVITIGLASGIMLSASIWSLLVPSLEYSTQNCEKTAFLPVSLGFLLGCLFMILLDIISKRLMKRNDFHTQKALNLFSAITIHNIPEGLAVGFAVGTAILDGTQAFGALMFALGIALQNFPEGLATALPLSTALKSRKKGAFLGILSGIVEPIFAVVGILLSTYIASILPWLLAFAAGSMIFVIIKELLPEIDQSQNTLGTIFFTIGFIIMMLLDICL